MTTEQTVACAGGCGQHKPVSELKASGWELAEAGRDHPTNGN